MCACSQSCRRLCSCSPPEFPGTAEEQRGMEQIHSYTITQLGDKFGEKLTYHQIKWCSLPARSCSFCRLGTCIMSCWAARGGVGSDGRGERLLWTEVRLETARVQGNQVHTINIIGLEIPNHDFQPILMKSNFYSIGAWHPSIEFYTKLDLNKSHIFRNPRVPRALLHI